jgi:hypothetical protein
VAKSWNLANGGVAESREQKHVVPGVKCLKGLNNHGKILIVFVDPFPKIYFLITGYIKVQMFEPFQDRNPHFFGTVSLS